MKVTFWMWVRNQGDGSVVVFIFPSEELAKKAEKQELEQTGEDWAESSVEQQTLDVSMGGLISPRRKTPFEEKYPNGYLEGVCN